MRLNIKKIAVGLLVVGLLVGNVLDPSQVAVIYQGACGVIGCE
jgi:hypothetical protein